jgi:hypothetical protein
MPPVGGIPRPPPPRAAALPPSTGSWQSIQRAAPAPQLTPIRQVNQYSPQAAAALKASPLYQRAVVSVFKMQGPQRQALLTKQALQSPHIPENQYILNYLHSSSKGGGVWNAYGSGGRFQLPQHFSVGQPNAALNGLGGLIGQIPAGASSAVSNAAGQAAGFARGFGIGGPNNYIGSPSAPGVQAGQGAAGAVDAGAKIALAPVGVAAQGLRKGITTLQGIGNQNPNDPTQMGGFGPPALGRVLTHAPLDVAQAMAEQPSTIPKTISGLGTTAIASGAGLLELPIKMATMGAGPALKQLGQGMAHDYSSRYGPVAAGNDQAFINRIKQQGAGPELLDALGLIGGFDATAGRAVTSLAKVREGLTGKPNFLTAERPLLRVSGNEVRQQALARGAGKITAQRVEDAMRRIRGDTGHAPPLSGKAEVRPLLGARAQKVLVSGQQASYRRPMQDMLQREVRGFKGIQGGFRGLTPWETKAALIVHEGFVPLRSGPEAALKALEARKQAILKERATNPYSPGNRIAPQHVGTVDDVKLITDLQANIGKWLTPDLAKFIAKESARQHRIMPADFRGTTASAEARLLRAQGEMLGIKHPDEVAAATQAKAGAPGGSLAADLGRARAMTEAQKYADWQETRPGLLRDYSAQIRKERPKDWPEPAFMEHSPHPKDQAGVFTAQGARGMPGYKQSHFDLWRGGAVYRSREMMINSVAKGVKGHYQWPLVSDLGRRNGVPAPTAIAVKDALGHGKAPSLLTGHEMAQAYAHMGLDLRNYTFWNPGRMSDVALTDLGYMKAAGEKSHSSRSGYAPPEVDTNQALADAMSQRDVAVKGSELQNALKNDMFMKAYGWKLLPNAAYKEIHAGLTPSGGVGRAVGKVQGGTAGLILGGSPSFVVMNTLAHAFLTAFATGGRILTDMVKAPIWYHGLSDAKKAVVDAEARGRGRHDVAKLGSTVPNAIVDSWRQLRASGIGRVITALNMPRTLLHTMWRTEDLQSNYFRHVVYYHYTKQLAFENMSHEIGWAATAMQRLMHVFTLGPKDRMAGILAHQPWAEEVGRRTVNALGDYARFTAGERKWLNNRSVIFYSFVRHAARTLFYVLPFKHPIVTALVGELGKLHKDEVQQILGPNPPPWDYGRVFFDKGGKLTSIDFTRSLPVGNVATELPSQGIGAATNLIPPELQPLVNMGYKHTPSGSPVPQNVFTFLNGIASLSYPYRLFHDLHFGTQLQQADSIPFIHERPETRKSAAGQAYLQAKEAALGPLFDKILGGMLGLYPKPDDSRVVTQHAATAAAKKAAAATKKATSGGYLLNGSSSSGNGGYLLNGSSTSGNGGYLLP